LYEMAKRQFDKANSIQAGVAAFNLACVHGVRGDTKNCLEALQIARQNANLPDDTDILADPDLANVINQPWFKDFMASLEEDRRIAEEKRLAAKAAEEEAKKPKPKDPNEFDPYQTTKADDKKPKAVPVLEESETKTGSSAATEQAATEQAPVAEQHVEEAVANTEDSSESSSGNDSTADTESSNQSDS
jgi:hypothetical protein